MTYLWSCRETSTTTIWIKRQHDTECNCDLVRVAHKVSGHHMHQATMVTNWLHQLLTVGVDRYVIICLKLYVLSFSHISFWKQHEDSIIKLVNTQETWLKKKGRVHTVLIQAAASIISWQWNNTTSSCPIWHLPYGTVSYQIRYTTNRTEVSGRTRPH